MKKGSWVSIFDLSSFGPGEWSVALQLDADPIQGWFHGEFTQRFLKFETYSDLVTELGEPQWFIEDPRILMKRSFDEFQFIPMRRARPATKADFDKVIKNLKQSQQNTKKDLAKYEKGRKGVK